MKKTKTPKNPFIPSTAILLIVDRSGSMSSILADAQAGIDSFIEEQVKQPGEALFFLADFDTEYRMVHDGIPLHSRPPFTLQPRGYTALLDAMGRAIAHVEAKIAALPVDQRPGKVVCVTVTDGHENRSTEYTKAMVKDLISRKQDTDGWHFTFLGADPDAFSDAGGMGISAANVANYDPHLIANAFAVTTQNLSAVREGTAHSMAYSVQQRGMMSSAPVDPDSVTITHTVGKT